MNAPRPTAAAVHELQRAGLAPRDIAKLCRVRTRVIEAMLATSAGACPLRSAQAAVTDLVRLLRLLELKAECVALRLEQVAGEGGAS